MGCPVRGKKCAPPKCWFSSTLTRTLIKSYYFSLRSSIFIAGYEPVRSYFVALRMFSTPTVGSITAQKPLPLRPCKCHASGSETGAIMTKPEAFSHILSQRSDFLLFAFPTFFASLLAPSVWIYCPWDSRPAVLCSRKEGVLNAITWRLEEIQKKILFSHIDYVITA